MAKPSIGRVVHYYEKGVHYAAIVTRTLPDKSDIVDLVVFDDRYLAQSGYGLARFDYSVPQDESQTWERSWHWPEREEA